MPQLDIEVGMCEQDTHIQEVFLRAVQMVGFANPRPQQMEKIKTFMLGKDVFVSSVANWIRQIKGGYGGGGGGGCNPPFHIRYLPLFC